MNGVARPNYKQVCDERADTVDHKDVHLDAANDKADLEPVMGLDSGTVTL